MYKLKTPEMLIAEGWARQQNGDWYYPDGDEYNVDLNASMVKMAATMPQADLDRLGGSNKTTNYGGYQWSPSMFIYAGTGSLLCQCQWNKHPLWCRCQ